MLNKINPLQRRKEARLHPHHWVIPEPEPTTRRRRYRSSSSSYDVAAPNPSIFRDVMIPYPLSRHVSILPTVKEYPAAGHVASHLLLIECFDRLRCDVETSSLAHRSSPGSFVSGPGGSDTLQSPWFLFLSLAIKRFRLWVARADSIIRHSAVFNKYGTGSHLYGAFTANYLPPIDVLLIWYCYLQDPAAYERLISSNNLILLSQICFPWDVVLLAINQDNLQYNFTAAAEALWSKMVGIPADCESCIHLDLTMSGAAFTSPEDEILELVVRQTEMTREIQQNLWLRSPALRGTIQRALVRYAQKVAISQAEPIFGTQQIPVMSFGGEARSMNDLELDLVAQLVLSTHRAYHSAWKAFAHIHNIHNSNEVPPPAYEKVDMGSFPGKRADSNTEESTCYCWICERVADEVQDSADNVSPLMRTLSLVSSPEEMDEKRSIYSDSSSETEEMCLHLKLSRRRIKAITTDIGLYRHIEAARHTRVNMAASSSPGFSS